ncbi:hypothetical protein [Salinibacterium sp.]|uniref:DUF7882 family protein n=1 Tax=Salinibacterium sp. TaxID=1915057 RepID=UPI00286AEE4B|nr:hypothetical protein [Salinibacterium sp.]
MGTLYYGDSRFAIHIDDRTLAHLAVVIVNKLRRGESFTFSWTKSRSEGHGRSTIWVSPSFPLHFEFDGNKSPSLNRRWLEELALVAGGGGGLVIVDEPPDGPGSGLPI